MNKHISDERLNAFIDNEMNSAEKQEVFDALRNDDELHKRIYELQKTHDLIKQTYQSIDPPTGYPPPQQTHTQPPLLRSMAAGVLLLVGLLLGWFSHQQIKPNPSLPTLAQTSPSPQPDAAAIRKILLHINTDDEYRLTHMLDETEHLLKTSQKNNENLLVEILTNGDGLALVKKSNSASTQRLQALQNRYDNLSVSVCAQALERLQTEKGLSLELIPDATVVNSALGEVLNRQREGWTYIPI